MHALPQAEGASFDSFANQDDTRCLEGTRHEILQEVHDWATASSGLTVQPAQENPQSPELRPHHSRRKDGLVQASSLNEASQTVAMIANLYTPLHSI